MVANAAGPVMSLYLLTARLDKLKFLGTAPWFFLLVNLFKVPFSIGSSGWYSASPHCRASTCCCGDYPPRPYRAIVAIPGT